ncbi:MAG: cobalt-precorrin-6A synthase, partial [Blautia sp.]
MNTHSHSADGRMEVLAASAVRAGAGIDLVREILECGTTDEALALLGRDGWLDSTMDVVMEKIQYYLDHRSYEQITLGAVVFSNVQGYLGQTKDAQILISEIQRQGVEK